jgi:chemotaxis protein methyltransferase CheR
MTRDDITFLAEVVRTRSGLVLGPDAAYLIENRLMPVARGEDLASVEALVALMRARMPERLLAGATEALANTETHFFRDRPAWDELRDQVLPALAALRGGEPVRIWSAACATGQEPYSLAMLAAETGLKLDICASDLSDRALEKARAGLYTQFEVQRGLSAARLLRHFDKVEDAWRVRAELRQAVRWRRFNLLDDPRPLGRFDLILCRHVVAGFEPEVRRASLTRLVSLLAPEGVLALGVGESGGPDMIEAASSGRGLFKLADRTRDAAPRTGT